MSTQIQSSLRLDVVLTYLLGLYILVTTPLSLTIAILIAGHLYLGYHIFFKATNHGTSR